MPRETASKDPIVFAALHGAWHGPEHFALLRAAIEERGHVLVAPRMPIEDPEATYSDYSDIVAQKLAGYDRVRLIAHSRSGNVAPLVAARMAVESITYLCGTIPVTKDQLDDDIDESLDKYTELNLSGVQTNGSLTMYDPEVAKQVFYDDCPPEVAEWAAAQLRPQRVRETNVVLPTRPEVTEHAIVGSYDQAIRPEWQRQRAAWVLGRSAIKELPTGHSPFLSQPELLADTLVNEAIFDQIHRTVPAFTITNDELILDA